MDWSISEYAKEYKRSHPVFSPQGGVTVRDPTIFTEEEVRDMPTFEESVTDSEARGELTKGKHLIADSTPVITGESVAQVSRIMIKVKEPGGDKLYYALDPVKGGKKGTEVNLQDGGLAAPPITFPKINLPNWKLPKFPTLEFPQISGLTKGIAGLVVLFIAGIVLLMAIGYSGMGGSAGRVGEREYKKRQK